MVKKKKNSIVTSPEVLPPQAEEEAGVPALLPEDILANSKEVALIEPKVGDPLTQYIKEISRYELLSPEQEKALTTALLETGDIEIAKKLVVSNLRLVVKIAMEYRKTYQNVMDLIQEG
ncbi:MAG: RNA polymerase subunit sigma-70, partial [Halobacteriovoraceae bacterium]|nr:RNA polymerase subunit sigma-70 [Halobacteriovoraceae bacterium]